MMSEQVNWLAAKMLHRSFLDIGDKAIEDYKTGIRSPENREAFRVIGTWLDGMENLTGTARHDT